MTWNESHQLPSKFLSSGLFSYVLDHLEVLIYWSFSVLNLPWVLQYPVLLQYVSHLVLVFERRLNILFCRLLSLPLRPQHLVKSKTNRLSNLINPSNCQDLNRQLQRDSLLSPSPVDPCQSRNSDSGWVDCLDPHLVSVIEQRHCLCCYSYSACVLRCMSECGLTVAPRDSLLTFHNTADTSARTRIRRDSHDQSVGVGVPYFSPSRTNDSSSFQHREDRDSPSPSVFTLSNML